jgi:hypothetical protein
MCTRNFDPLVCGRVHTYPSLHNVGQYLAARLTMYAEAVNALRQINVASALDSSPPAGAVSVRRGDFEALAYWGPDSVAGITGGTHPLSTYKHKVH